MVKRAPQNRTLILGATDIDVYSNKLTKLFKAAQQTEIENQIINQDFFEAINFLPSSFVDLLFVDPPYNLTKSFNGHIFKKMSFDDYKNWVEKWVVSLKRVLKPNASIYICGDWRTSSIIQLVCQSHFHVMNRITIEREKGRGSNRFWKNTSEDIWFFTNSKKYYFNAGAVKLRKKVLAPYKEDGKPKSWESDDVGKFRLTYPSNLWTDITIPFWSMPENTPHPTQKPEKLLAKIILASSKKNDVVLDPFGGVGTTAVVAKKLGRKFVSIELDKEYCLYSMKRLELAETNKEIQGYKEGFFWERNSLNNKQK